MSEVLFQEIEKLAVDANAKTIRLRKGETMVEVEQTELKNFISHLVKDTAVHHLSTITGLDMGDKIGIIYHFWRDKDTIHVRTSVPKTNPTAVSIVDIVPGAILYEMEVHDMFGVTFTGNAWINRKLLLPDTWPDDLAPPLLRTTKPAEIRKRLKLEVERK